MLVSRRSSVRQVARRSPVPGRWDSAGGVLFDGDGNVVVVKQEDRSSRLRWTLPKGRQDEGETLEQAALREVREETGWRARVVGFVWRHEGERHDTSYYLMELVRREGEPCAETHELRLVTPAKALSLLRGKRDRRALLRALTARAARP
jgi:8-oxo-dGTP pyrophosphatase MutT (NUDIX family)